MSTLYGPMNLGQSLDALPFGRFRFLVDKYTRSPLSIRGSSRRSLLAIFIWNTQAPIIASCASAKFDSACSAKSLMPLGTTLSCQTSWIIEGMYPPFSSNGAYLVVADTLAFIANSVMSTRSTQSNWSGRTSDQKIWPTVRFARSVWPSV